MDSTQHLNHKELKAAYALLTGLYAVPAIQDWYERGQHLSWELFAGTFCWLILFYWGPFSLLLVLDAQTKTRSPWRTPMLWIGYFCSMLLGIAITDLILSELFPGFSMSAYTLTFSAFLWSTFNFTLYRSFLLYKTLQTERLKHKQSQLNTLKQQLNPHFLFNSLNTISAFVHDKPEEAEEAIVNLANVLRYSLDVTAKDKVSVSEEVDILTRYIQLEQSRFSEKLHIELNVARDCYNKMLPPMLLQPLVENAIKHTQQWPLHITVDINLAQEHRLTLIVRDNGGGLQQSGKVLSKGHGLGITHERISLEQNAFVHLENIHIDSRQGLQVTLDLAV